MRYINGQIVLNKKETKDMLFALQVIKDNQNTYHIGIKKEDAKLNKQSVSAYQSLSMAAVRLGVIE